MQTHDDASHFPPDAFPMKSYEDQQREFLKRLEERAAEMVRDKKSEITAGRNDEQTLAEWNFRGIGVRQLPDDEQGILRISIGGDVNVNINYCVFRGNRQACINLLRDALVALQQKPTE